MNLHACVRDVHDEQSWRLGLSVASGLVFENTRDPERRPAPFVRETLIFI